MEVLDLPKIDRSDTQALRRIARFGRVIVIELLAKELKGSEEDGKSLSEEVLWRSEGLDPRLKEKGYPLDTRSGLTVIIPPLKMLTEEEARAKEKAPIRISDR